MMRGSRACSSMYHVYKGSTVKNICNSRIRCSVLVNDSSHHVHGFNQVRYLSNEDFRRTLERLKNSGSKVNNANKNAESVSKKQDVDSSDNVSDRIASETDGSSKGNASSNKNSNIDNEKDSDTQSANLGGDSQSNSGSSSTNSTANSASAFSRASSYLRSFDIHQLKDLSLSVYDQVAENTKLAYLEMTGRDAKDSLLKRKVEQAESFRAATREVNGEDDEDDVADKPSATAVGPSSIVVVKEPKSAWDSMKDRLQDSPFIQEIIRNSRKFSRTAAETPIGKKASEVGQSVKDKIEDMREFWETSQNPLVYTLSGVWDTMTGETEEGIAVSAIRKLDPKFSKEEWSQEVKANLVPIVIKAHLMGNTNALKPWLGEGVYNKLAADIRARKHDGIVFDCNLLDIDENRLIVRFLESGGPVIVGVYMVQQINCIRNRKGEIIEGGESEIRAKFYSMAFQQSFDEDSSTVQWKVVDYEFAGDIPYY